MPLAQHGPDDTLRDTVFNPVGALGATIGQVHLTGAETVRDRRVPDTQ